MKKVILFISPVFLAIVVFAVFLFFTNRLSGKGALQVTANPKSEVFLNGVSIGKTPLCKCEPRDMVDVSEYSIRLVPEEGSFLPFEDKIKIDKSVLTVVDRTFGQGSSEGSILTLEKLSTKNTVEILVISSPNTSQVFLDNSFVGQTPLLLKDITASDHEIKLKKNGYKEKIVRVRTKEGFKLAARAFLSIDEKSFEQKSPSASSSASPTPTPLLPQVEILKTPTGFLRVRAEANLASKEVGRVNQSEIFELLEETSGWYKIRLSDGTTGWVSSQYAKKKE